MLRFSPEARCAHCKDHDLKCWSATQDDKCISCAAAGRLCIFPRIVLCSGPRQLLNLYSVIGGNPSNQEVTSSNTVNYKPDKIVREAFQQSETQTSGNSVGSTRFPSITCVKNSEVSEPYLESVQAYKACHSQVSGEAPLNLLKEGACSTNQAQASNFISSL